MDDYKLPYRFQSKNIVDAVEKNKKKDLKRMKDFEKRLKKNKIVNSGSLSIDLVELYIDNDSNVFNDRKYIKRKKYKGIKNAKKILSILKYFCGDFCCSCYTSYDLTIDHIIPVSKGGTNYIENLQILCNKCNQIKKDNNTDYRSENMKSIIELKFKKRGR